MKTKSVLKRTAVCVVALVSAAAFCACSAGKAQTLGKPKESVPVSYEERSSEEFSSFKQKTEVFASSFAESAYEAYEGADNFAVSPVSVFMALSLAAECASGQTREELLSALGVSYEELRDNFSTLYRSLEVEHKSGSKTTGVLNLTNSVWVNDGTPVNQECIDTLSDSYYAFSYGADFKNDNAAANQAIRNFIKKQTRGLIDKDFELSQETLFALINTLYLKTIWNTDGNDLPFTAQDYAFTAADGTVTNKKLLQGYYNGGRVYETQTYSSFYTRTHDGYKIKFLLPKEGYSVEDIYTKENILALNAIKDYGGYDEENNTAYYTRCMFPSYKCKYDNDVSDILRNQFGVSRFFKDPGIYADACEFETLSSEPCYCSSVKHVVDLTVNEKGIEGAAVTVIAMDAATAGEPMKKVYADFVVDRAFGFLITDYQNVTLFSGVVNHI